LKHIEGRVQVTALIKRHWQRASSAIAGGSTRDPSSGGKRISLSPMPIYLLKRSDERIWVLMTTVTSFQSATSLAKRQNPVPAPVFQPVEPGNRQTCGVDQLREADGESRSVGKIGFVWTLCWRKADSNHRSRSEKSGRSETRASVSCIAQPTGAAAKDIGADDRQAAGDQIIATRLRRRSCR
jgi:hypothetical protein